MSTREAMPGAVFRPDLAQLSSEERRGLLQQMLASPAAGVRAVPMSFAQERLWFLDRLVPDHPFYNVDAVIRLRGALDAGALEKSLQTICARHETLRTTFGTVAGRPTQFIHPRSDLRLRAVSLQPLPETDRIREALLLVREEGRRPFDLAHGPVIRTTLLELTPDDRVLLVTLHHIVADGWSMGVLIGELAALYNSYKNGGGSALPPLPIQYADYAQWQRKRLNGEGLSAQLDYWQRQLDALTHLELPTDWQRPAKPAFEGGRVYFEVPAITARRIRELGKEHNATLFMTLLAAFSVLLHRDTSQNDIVIGTPIAGRNRPELEPLIGFFVNTLVIRTQVGGDASFRAVLAGVRDHALDAFAHQELPFERLVEELQPDRDLSRNPLCQVVFSLQNAPTSTLSFEGLDVTFPSIGNDTTRFELVLDVWELPDDDRLHARFEFSRDLFQEETVAAMGRRFVTLLEGIAADPEAPVGRIPILTDAERQRLVVEWNDTAAPMPSAAAVHHLVRDAAEKAPGRIAVAGENEAITYEVLERTSNRLANHLLAAGAAPEGLVAVCMEPSAGWIVALLAVLKCGAAYVALDPASPRARLHRMLEDAAPLLLVTTEAIASTLAPTRCPVICVDRDANAIARAGDRDPEAPVTPDSLAYVIFTSGSTGEPNGVRLEHRGLLNLIAWHQRSYEVTPDDRASQVAGPGFDASVWEVWPYLAAGASVQIAGPSVRLDPSKLMTWLAAHRITLAFLPTPLAEAALAGPLPRDLALRYLLTGGDRLRRAPRQPLPFTLVNHYGPTEYSVVSTAGVVQPVEQTSAHADIAPSIGRPIANTQVYVLDSSFQLVPPRIPGQLAVAGMGLARGYLGRDALTDERFVPNPFVSRDGAAEEDAPAPRMYLTGDQVRWRHDGQLEFMGRIDTQVSVRGFRVEVAEIEAALARHPAVGQVVVNARRDPHGDTRLTAYVVRSEEDRRRDELEERSRVENWRSLYDTTYQATVARDPSFDITGWHSSYTGLPISEDEMREWVDAAVARIRRRGPKRVLEIGVGTGLLLHRLAPECDEYTGIDFSQAALALLARRVQDAGLANVRLRQAAADQLDEFREGSFDAVILNSVVQYFPGAAYLNHVLDRATALVRPGGFVFVGDVRSLPLQRTFNISVELHRAPGNVTIPQFLNRVRSAGLREEELLLAPRFFDGRRDDRRIAEVRVQMKRGRRHNELTRFRYDVFLEVADSSQRHAPHGAPAWLDWDDDRLTLPGLGRLLNSASADVITVRNVPNARLVRETGAAALLSDRGNLGTVAELRDALQSDGAARANRPESVDFETACDRAAEHGYHAEALWMSHGPDGRFDLELSRVRASTAPGPEPGHDIRLRSGSTWPSIAKEDAHPAGAAPHYANNPLQFSLSRKLVPQLRRTLRERLPDYMVPASYVFLDTLPMTPNAKVHRQLLPDPAIGRDGVEGESIPPRTPVEEVIASLWSELLGSERVGVRDNFFDLGGHSLLGMQLIGRLRDAFRVELPVSCLFDTPTVEGLAEQLIAHAPSAQAVERLARLALTVSRMSDQEVAARLQESTADE
jgi:amino acid adenylation domain-containing protein